jgi:putative membrane protein
MKATTGPRVLLLALGAWLAVWGASAQTINQGAVMQDTASLGDAEFVRRAAMANCFEIEEAQLTLAQGSDPRLKEFARTMVMDHGVALKDLETAARMAGVTVPDRKLDEAHQARINAVSRKKGADFDQQYRADQRQVHDEAIALLVAYQQSGRSEQLRAWAIKMLPVVRQHRQAIGALSTQ